MPNKLDYTVVKSDHIISLLNFLGKVCGRVVADMLPKWCEVYHILHKSHIGSRRQRSAFDIISRVVNRVQRTWSERKQAGILLMNVKGAFNHVSRNCFLRVMVVIAADGDLKRSTKSFKSNRRVGQFIDRQ